MIKILLSMFLLGTLFSVNAQMPSYLPKDSLKGWYPFNGNANDESGNGNTGTVNGATLVNDRNGNLNSAYNFDGVDDFINTALTQGTISAYTISCWIKTSNSSMNSCSGGGSVVQSRGPSTQKTGKSLYIHIGESSQPRIVGGINGEGLLYGKVTNNNFDDGAWHHVVCTWSSSVGVVLSSNDVSLYIDGALVSNATSFNYDAFGPTKSPINSPYNTLFGKFEGCNPAKFFSGLIDDIGIWNRALSSAEITDLFVGCKLSISNEPTNQSSSISSQAQFNTLANDTTSSYQWQSNQSNLGWVNIPSNSVYSGVTSKKLTVNNIKLKNHEQLFRVIASKNTCKDTSVVAMLTVNDTCITSTTDTLYIKVNTSSLSNPVYNTVKVYPNPSSTKVIIDNGNYSTMGTYTAKIVNSIGQQVFQSVINQQQFVIDAKTMGGAGVYTLYITDANNKVVGVKKIVLQ